VRGSTLAKEEEVCSVVGLGKEAIGRVDEQAL
jgi:hypothetical protein